MKTLIAAIVLATAAVTTTTASAYTCTNKVERINGEIAYTYSQCGNQAPASQKMLDLMSFHANNPSEDPKEVVVDNTTEIKALKKERRKLNRQIDRLKDKRDNATSNKRKKKLTEKIKSKKQERKSINQQIKALR